jgi:hypothetical protein
MRGSSGTSGADEIYAMEQVRHFDEPKVGVSWHSSTCHRHSGSKADVPYRHLDSFKMQSQGVYVPRASFPQLPGSVCVNPTFIQTKHG